MRAAEDDILAASLRVFQEKTETFQTLCPGGDVERFYREQPENQDLAPRRLWQEGGKISAEEGLKEQLASLPLDMFPIVICGGSFNSSQRRTQLREEDKAFMDALLENADPEKVFFVVGHTGAGQDGYLVRQAAGRFRVFAIVPNRITRMEKNRLQEADVGVLVSIESSGMGLYKSFAYEIFKRMPSALLAFDGNSAALNLIQEARNGRMKCKIYINPRSRGLAAKAKMLEGYVEPLRNPKDILKKL